MISFRPLEDRDVDEVVALWTDCGLTRPWNDPRRDIALARGKPGSDILIGMAGGRLVSSVLVGHDGHRGWLYYVAVTPALQRKGFGKATVGAAEAWLKERGIWAVNLNIRTDNTRMSGFYEALGYEMRDVVVMGKRDLA